MSNNIPTPQQQQLPPYPFRTPPPVYVQLVGPRNGIGVTALVLGLVGLVIALIPLLGFIAILLGALGAVLGLVGVRRVRNGKATNEVMSWFGFGLSAAAIAIGIVGLVILNTVFNQLDQDLHDIGPRSESSSADGSPSGSAPPAAPPTIGSPVRDGRFEFTVTEVATLGTTVGPEFIEENAQGEYLGVTMTVQNIGDEPQTFRESDQTMVIDAKDYSADTMATFVRNGDGMITEINPGNTLTVTIVYDVPAGSQADSIELHDSAFSGGTTVNLGQR